MPTPQHHVAIIVMGVSGTGKSTLGFALAHALGEYFAYIEGDELHPQSNIDKMSSGVPLTDADREPWLAAIREMAKEKMLLLLPVTPTSTSTSTTRSRGVVIACSALKKYYRDILRGRVAFKVLEPYPVRTYFVFISGSRESLYRRLEARPGHFMKADMLDSQLATLESPVGEEDVMTVAMEDVTERQLAQVIEGLRQAGVIS